MRDEGGKMMEVWRGVMLLLGAVWVLEVLLLEEPEKVIQMKQMIDQRMFATLLCWHWIRCLLGGMVFLDGMSFDEERKESDHHHRQFLREETTDDCT
jgi:hypothetical protein